MFVYESFARSRSRPSSTIGPWSKASSAGRVVHGMPERVWGERGVETERHQAEVGGGELPLAGVPVGIADRLELLEPGQLGHVHLPGELGADRVLEREPRLEVAAR